MTVVMGLVGVDFIAMASDGYALEQDAAGAPVRKRDFYSKVQLLGSTNYIVGIAGSHALGVEFTKGVEDGGSYLGEEELLTFVGDQVGRLNQNEEGKKTSFLLGFFSGENPRLYSFGPEGGGKRIETFVAIGSGADHAMEFFCANQPGHRSLRDTTEQLIRAVFAAAQAPTVNFVPMVAYLRSGSSMDLSSKSISMFEQFKEDLVTILLSEIPST